MNLSFTTDLLEMKTPSMEFVSKELKRNLRERERSGDFSLDGWRASARFAIQGLPIPEEFGDSRADILATILLMEGLSYSFRDKGLVFSLNAQMWSIELPLLKFGTSAQKRAYLLGLVSVDLIGVLAMTEAVSGSDALSMRRRDERYTLNGAKLYITNAQIADIVIAFPSLNPYHNFAGSYAFLVEKGSPGFEVSRSLDKIGLRISPMGEIILWV